MPSHARAIEGRRRSKIARGRCAALANGGSEITEADWLAEYARTIQLAQEFEGQLLGLLLSVRGGHAQKAAEAFRELLDDLSATSGTIFKRLFENRKHRDLMK